MKPNRPDLLELRLERELEYVRRQAVKSSKYSRVSRNRDEFLLQPFWLVKEGKNYECWADIANYNYGWEVAPSREAWDAQPGK